MLSDQRGDRWRRATFSPEAPAATLGGAVSQAETSDVQTGSWPLCSALRDPVSREQGSPWGNKGQGARGRSRQEEAKLSTAPPHLAEQELDLSRRPGSSPWQCQLWSLVGGHGRNHRFCNSCNFPMFEIGCVTSGSFPHTT